ncbi:MAG: DUF1449 family protein [Flavobacteriales bacterium]|nr:DUF1449 family protein [Flavobacteriales bacterium]
MIDILFAPANLIVTTLFLVIVLYWLIVLFGAIDTEAFDFDFDVDADADVDADVDSDSSNIFGLNKILTFFNLGKIPFMVFLTFLILPWWFGTVIVNNLMGFESFIMGLLVTGGMFFAALIVSKILTQPFVKIFAALDKEDGHPEILGAIGEVTISATSSKTGQAEVKAGNSFLKINIRSNTELDLKPGDKVLVIDENKGSDFYLVEIHYTID